LIKSNIKKEKYYMGLAIELAKKARNPSPNPYVGAVIVKNGRIAGRGFHLKAGDPHAEINAIRDAGKNVKGSTLYVNLEPCAHWGRTPPCTDAIAEAGIREVVIGIKDPNPLVNGKGITRLKKAGVKVSSGILEQESRKLNEVYTHYIIQKIPFVLLKTAMSLDGKIAARTGESRWISGEQSRKYVKQLRAKFDAVLVGINTVLRDDPELTTVYKFTSLQVYKEPLKIIVDSRLKIPLRAKLLKKPEEVIVAATNKAPKNKARQLERLGVRVLAIKAKKDRIDIKALMKKLAEMEISSVFIEGGGEINASAIESGIVDKVLFFIAPKFIGGRDAKTPVEGRGIARMAQAAQLRNITVRRIGLDIIVEGYL